VLAVVIPSELLAQAGDLTAVAAGYDGPKSLLAFFNALGSADASSQGLITWSYLGDWKAIDTPNNKFVANINYLMAALLTAEVASAVGESADAVADLALAAALSSALQAKFFDAAGKRWDAGSQSAQILALAFGAGDASVQQPAADALVAALAAADGHATFGASGSRFALSVLHDVVQRPDLALELALSQGYPSWQLMVSNASMPGTAWEDWNGPAEPDGSSDNHVRAPATQQSVRACAHTTAAHRHRSHRAPTGLQGRRHHALPARAGAGPGLCNAASRRRRGWRRLRLRGCARPALLAARPVRLFVRARRGALRGC
jgi:hypothetical protein